MLYGAYRFLTSLLPVRCPKAEGDLLFHASSVGEVNAAYPLIGRFRGALLSVFTSHGYDYARSLGLRAVRFPYDSPRCVGRLLEGKRGLVIVETEIWPNLIHAAHSRGIPIIVVNATMGERSFRWYSRVPLFRRTVSSIDLVLAQSDEDARRFRELGARDVRVVGNLKFDSVERPLKTLPLRPFRPEGAILFANVRGKEIGDVAEAARLIRRSVLNVKFMVAPRHLENVGALSSAFRRQGFSVSYLTDPDDTDALVIDTIGDLWSLYRWASVVFVGGTLRPYGGHSFIEPAFWGRPIVSGPHFHRQPYVREMVREGAVLVVRTYEELAQILTGLILSPDVAVEVGRRAREFYERNRGVVDRVEREIRLTVGE
ncbi:MAG: hypothetical protein GXO29_07690 [Thermotogae bacterium]|nr:hypothetical protein [Thermotogota bacterium]